MIELYLRCLFYFRNESVKCQHNCPEFLKLQLLMLEFSFSLCALVERGTVRVKCLIQESNTMNPASVNFKHK